MYVRGYLQGSENGRVVTIAPSVVKINQKSEWKRFPIRKRGKNADLIGKESL